MKPKTSTVYELKEGEVYPFLPVCFLSIKALNTMCALVIVITFNNFMSFEIQAKQKVNSTRQAIDTKMNSLTHMSKLTDSAMAVEEKTQQNKHQCIKQDTEN